MCAFWSIRCWTGAVSRSFGAVARFTWSPTQIYILRDLAPLNEGRDKRDQISYHSLWVHAKRHYDLAGIVAYRRTRMHKEFRKALRG